MTVWLPSEAGFIKAVLMYVLVVVLFDFPATGAVQ